MNNNAITNMVKMPWTTEKEAKKSLSKKILTTTSTTKKMMRNLTSRQSKEPKTSTEHMISWSRNFTTRKEPTCSFPKKTWQFMSINRLIELKLTLERDREEQKSNYEGKKRRFGKPNGRRSRKNWRNVALLQRSTEESRRELGKRALRQCRWAMRGEDPDKDKMKKEVMDNCSESRMRVHKKNTMTNRQK